jgi:amino acid transporter
MTASQSHTVVAEQGPTFGDLVAAGSGTAMASVCIVGLLQVRHLAPGLWAAAAVMIGGLLCWALARVFGRLMHVVPSGAGLFAYLARGLGRRAGLLLVLPYIVMALLLVGFEALVVGALLAQLAALPVLAGAFLFLVASWGLCQSGIRIGYRAQAVSTWALFASLSALSVLSLVGLARSGDLTRTMLADPPTSLAFAAAIGQSLFLFMGFELLTSHVEIAPKERVRRSLLASVGVLTVFYAGVSLGLATLPPDDPALGGFVVPQLLIAGRVGTREVTAAVAVVCILASFASFNGGLLGMSRLVFVLAAQGILPRRFAVLQPGRLTARPALALLLFGTVAATLLLRIVGLYSASILAAAVSTALVYAAAAWIREVPPFREIGRSALARASSFVLAIMLVALAVGVIADAGEVGPALLGLLAAIYGVAWVATGRGANRVRAKAAGRSLVKRAPIVAPGMASSSAGGGGNDAPQH